MAKNIAAAVREIITPAAEQLGYIIWDVEFVREGATDLLRITIDKDGGIDINDCEKMHRAIDPLLDEADPIDKAYSLEVSSPGLGRQIKNEEQANRCLGMEVTAKLYAPDADGNRIINGTLSGFADGNVTIETVNGTVTAELKKTAKLCLCDD